MAGWTWVQSPGGDLSQSDIDTFAELNAIVADETLLAASSIDSLAKLNTIVGSSLANEFTGTAGSVIFLGGDGKFAEDNDKLFFDDTNDRLGVKAGTSPEAVIHAEEALDATHDLVLFRRTASEPTAFSLFVGPSGTTPDFAVWGDGRCSIGEAETTTNAMLRIKHPVSSPAGGTAAALFIDSDNTGSVVGLEIDHEGTTGDAIQVSSACTTGFGIDMQCDALTSGSIASFRSNSSSAVARELVEIVNDHTSGTNALPLYIRNDATGPLARFLNLSSDTLFEWHVDGYWKVGKLLTTDVAPSTASPPYKLSLQELANPPTNAAYFTAGNWPNSPTTELYLAVEDG